jgi:hypothetical protein
MLAASNAAEINALIPSPKLKDSCRYWDNRFSNRAPE